MPATSRNAAGDYTLVRGAVCPYWPLAVVTSILPAGWAAEIVEQIADGRSAVVPDAGHCPQIEQPHAVNELLLDFFEGA